MTRTWDAIVVGARCAGSPLAMLLARKGYRVLLVDRAHFPSDTISTHVVQPLAAAALARWGLLDRLVATGCPAVHTYSYDFGPITLEGAPGTPDSPVAYCPRRAILDTMLVRAAADAGAEVREGFTMESLVIDDGRVAGIVGHTSDVGSVTELARVVIGADGRHSVVAARVRPEQYHEKEPLLAAYYAYWSGLPMRGRFETYIRPARGFAAAETHDGLTMIVGGWPFAEFEQNRSDVEGAFLGTLAMAPEFAERLRGAKRETRFAGAATPSFFRKPYGSGWALVGDAGYTKDPITAQGINDAFRDAERCAEAIDASLSGRRSFDDAMADYQRRRDDQVMGMFQFTCDVASMTPPSPEMQQLFGAIRGNQGAMDGFARVNAGTTPPSEFFSPANIGSIISAAHPPS